MFTLVTGGAASGKSEYAESLAMRLPGRRIYLATMRPADPESLARINRHRRLRQGRGFDTLERSPSCRAPAPCWHGAPI